MPGGEKEAVWRRLGAVVLRYGPLVLLPATITASSGFAGAAKGQAKTNLVLLAIFFTLVVSAFNVYKEVRGQKAGRSAVQLATNLTKAGEPLVTLLAKVAAEDGEARRSDTQTLIARCIGIAHSESGRFGRNRGATRAVFYRFTNDEKLVRYSYFEGRQGRRPRPDFIAERSVNDRRVIEIASGEDYLLVPDVDKAAPEYFLDYQGREYKSFLMVPVRAGARSYGFLTVDSDQPYSLTKMDVGYVTLMARLVGAALALVGGRYPEIDPETAAADSSYEPPAQGGGTLASRSVESSRRSEREEQGGTTPRQT